MGDGSPVVNLSLATSESWKDRSSGERKERTEWHRIVIFNENLAKIAQQYLKKGSTIYIEGQLQTRKWTDQSGVDKYSTEIVLQRYRGELTMLGGKQAEGQQRQGYSENHHGAHGGQSAGGELDDEVPF